MLVGSSTVELVRLAEQRLRTWSDVASAVAVDRRIHDCRPNSLDRNTAGAAAVEFAEAAEVRPKAIRRSRTAFQSSVELQRSMDPRRTLAPGRVPRSNSPRGGRRFSGMRCARRSNSSHPALLRNAVSRSVRSVPSRTTGPARIANNRRICSTPASSRKYWSISSSHTTVCASDGRWSRRRAKLAALYGISRRQLFNSTRMASAAERVLPANDSPTTTTSRATDAPPRPLQPGSLAVRCSRPGRGRSPAAHRSATRRPRLASTSQLRS